MKKIEILDYAILMQLVGTILYVVTRYHRYELVILYFSMILFIGYWLMRIVFRKPAPKKVFILMEREKRNGKESEGLPKV